jgi:copper resistance protein D
LDDPLIYVRAVHFAATISVAGVVFFVVLVAEPAFRVIATPAAFAVGLRQTFRWVVWIALVFTVLSGAAWFMLTAEAMSDRSLDTVFSDGIPGIVLLQTGFGRDWLLRGVLTCLLAALLGPFLSGATAKPFWLKLAVVLLVAALVGALVGAGHAAGGSDTLGIVHEIADVLHLVAAAAWVGTLLPLALLLAAAMRDPESVDAARTATVRFSTLGIVSVGMLIVTGAINTWCLAGSVAALTETDYGLLLLGKIALFLVMVAIAAVNRLRFTPRLVRSVSRDAALGALRRISRNTLIEVVAGAAVIAIVAVLGVTPPGEIEEAVPHGHHHDH